MGAIKKATVVLQQQYQSHLIVKHHRMIYLKTQEKNYYCAGYSQKIHCKEDVPEN